MSSDSNNMVTSSPKKQSKIINLKLHRIKKMLKPVMKFLHKKGSRMESTKQIPASQTPVEPEIPEADQNSANEALECRLQEDLMSKSEKTPGMIGVWMEGRMTYIHVVQGRHIPIPVHFACTPSGEFAWSPLADSDICWRGGDVQTTGQTPEEQVPFKSTEH